MYCEKPNVIQKYLRRSDDLEDLCLAQFVKMYDSSNAKKKSEEVTSDSQLETNEDDNEQNLKKESIETIPKKKLKYLICNFNIQLNRAKSKKIFYNSDCVFFYN